MAQLGAAATMDSAQMPTLQLHPIQAGRVAFARWHLRDVCSAPGSLYVLLEAVLLVFHAKRILRSSSGSIWVDFLNRPTVQ